jgi:hypothetical protein
MVYILSLLWFEKANTNDTILLFFQIQLPNSIQNLQEHEALHKRYRLTMKQGAQLS